jgi:Vam6/Vps39-like protein vacuolar protein sorting-associated protein 39
MIYPFSATKNAKNNANIQYSLRLLTPSPLSKAPFYVLSAPNDRTTLATEGTTLWMFCMQPWENQIDELVNGCKYVEALELLESLNDSDLPDKVRVFFTPSQCLMHSQAKRRSHIRALHGVALLAQKKFEEAINVFLELDVNPAKVLAMFPVEVAGRLAQPQSKWTELFGERELKGVAVNSLMDDSVPGANSENVTVVVDSENATSTGENVNREVDSGKKTDTSTSES